MKDTDPFFYRELERRRLVTSLRTYSRYIGMADNYACLRGERGPSERALVYLFRRLWAERRPLLALRVAYALLFRCSTEDGR